MTKFTNPNDPNNTQIHSVLKRWISEKLNLNEGTVIEIEEHGCTEASCVHAETFFHIKNGENTEGGASFYKIAKPLVFIRKWDIDGMKKIEKISLTHRH